MVSFLTISVIAGFTFYYLKRTKSPPFGRPGILNDFFLPPTMDHMAPKQDIKVNGPYAVKNSGKS